MTAIVFDLDGTLIDSAPEIQAATNKMLVDAGAEPLSLATVTSFVGNGLAHLVSLAMQERGLNMAHHAEFTRATLAHYDAAGSANTVLYPTVIETLERLQGEGAAMGICTNKPESAARLALEELGLAKFFPVVLGGDSLAVKKPDPEPLHAVFAALNAKTGLYVGDSEVDAATAQAAGVPFALFTEGYRKSAVEELPHDHAFSDFEALPEIVKKTI